MERNATTAKDIFRGSGRNPSIRQVRAVEVYLDGNGRKSKAEALREVGYSASVADHPDKVFNSRAVVNMMEEMGVTDKLGIEILKRNAQAKTPTNFTFPPFRPLDEKGNIGDNFGEQLTDDQIREYLKGAGCTVTKIVHGEQARHIYCYTLNNKAQLATAGMIFNLTGAYAPRKVDGKHDHRVGVFSMRELREKMRENGIEITDKIPSKI